MVAKYEFLNFLKNENCKQTKQIKMKMQHHELNIKSKPKNP